MALDDRDYMRDRARNRATNKNHDSWANQRRPSMRTKRAIDPKSSMMTVIVISSIAFAIVNFGVETKPKRNALAPPAGEPTKQESSIPQDTGLRSKSEPRYIPMPIAPEVTFPVSGSLGWWANLPPGMPLAQVTIRDVSDDPRPKVYRFRQSSSGARVVDAYLAPGGTAVVSIPVDVYSISLGAGTRWEGQERQFGPHGGYWDMGKNSYPQPSGPGGMTYSQRIMPFRIVANSTRTNWQIF